jgi:catechol 2,3-dioxygenase-like lactoylglutathione lyase family enzyme
VIKGFSHIYLPVRDVKESIDFYTQKLGFELFRSWENNGRASAYCKLGGILLELTLSDKTPSIDGRFEPRLGVVVDDIEAEIARLRDAGVHVEREPWEAFTFYGRQAMIKDPSGYVISLRQWRDPDGPDYEDWKPEQEGVVRTDKESNW